MYVVLGISKTDNATYVLGISKSLTKVNAIEKRFKSYENWKLVFVEYHEVQ